MTFDFVKQIFDSTEANEAIAADCRRCHAELRANPTDQFFRRALVRNVCSVIEVRLFHMSSALLSLHEGMPALLKAVDAEHRERIQQYLDCSLTAAEMLTLKEQSPAVDHKGVVNTRPAFLGQLDRFRLVTALFVRTLRLAEGVDYTTEGWKSTQILVNTCNRLVHPKSKESSEVPDEELRHATIAELWTLETMNRLIESGNSAAANFTPLLRDTINSLLAETARLVQEIVWRQKIDSGSEKRSAFEFLAR